MHGDSYFLRHWQGELSLRKSYWLNHIVLGGIATKLAFFAVATLQRGFGEQPRLCMALVGAILIPWIAEQAWNIGGTWRCATHARLDGRFVRATIVQLVLCLSVAGTAMLTVGALLPLVRALVNGQPVPVAGAVIRDGGRVIAFSGPISSASAEAFRRVLDNAQPTVVLLDSDGGLVAQARAIAGMIRARGLDTEVTHRCASACTIMFFAGRNRRLVGAGILGFHSYNSLEETPQSILREEERDRRVYLQGGVSPDFVDRMFSIPPARMWFPTRKEAEAAGFATPAGVPQQ